MTHITTAFIHLYICTTYVDYVKLHVYVPYTLVLLESAATTSTATLLSSLIHVHVDPCSPKDALIHLYLLYVSNSTNRWCLEFSFADFCGGGPDVQT